MCDAVGKRLARVIMKAIKPSPMKIDPVDALPEEILHIIWRLLDLKDLLNASLVSRQWYASLSSDSVWKRYIRETTVSTPEKSTQKKFCSSSTWKKKFLSQRSLVHNWFKSKYYVTIKSPVTGHVTATSDEVCIWKGSSVAMLSPLNTKITNHTELKEKIELIQADYDTDNYLLITTETKDSYLYLSNSLDEPILSFKLDQNEKKCKITKKYICRHRQDTLLLYKLAEIGIDQQSIQLPDCKKLQSYHILDTCILVRLEPLDFNYEVVYYLYNILNKSWNIVTKVNRSPMGCREFFEYTYKDYYILVNNLFVDDTYMYSNMYLYLQEKTLCREIISNCVKKYFYASFSNNYCLYTVADYRLSALDLNSLKSRELYVNASFDRFDTVLDRFIVLVYKEKLEIWDCKYWKRLYVIQISEKDKVLVRNEFIAVTSWPDSSMPPSLKILNFTEPELAESPSCSTFDLSNIFI